jgi:hypothetical protein
VQIRYFQREVKRERALARSMIERGRRPRGERVRESCTTAQGLRARNILERNELEE